MAKNFNWDNTARQMVPMVFEWEEQRRMKENKEQFNALTYQKPSINPVKKGDRVLVDICTRDRHLPLSCLLVSLRTQTFRDWDVLVQCDDSDESMPNDFMVMSIMGRLQHEGHGWRIIRGHRQGPHIGHDRSLQMAADDPNYKYKLVCRIDDDIIVDPTYLENLIEPFYGDEKTEIAAVGGVYLDPGGPTLSRSPRRTSGRASNTPASWTTTSHGPTSAGTPRAQGSGRSNTSTAPSCTGSRSRRPSGGTAGNSRR
jgi:hypothetical protein